MNITIINGSNTDAKYTDFEQSLVNTITKLKESHQVNVFTPRDMDLNYCTGCWNCWTKTPGQCMFKDDGEAFLEALTETDALIIASPIVAGFLSKETKKIMDRFLPVTLPSIRIFDGECHHLPRYRNFDISGLILFDDNADQEAIEILYENFDRVSKNTHSKHIIKQCLKADQMEVLIDEISSI